MTPKHVKTCYIEIPCDDNYSLDELIETLTKLRDRLGGNCVACKNVELKYWREMTPEEAEAHNVREAQIKEIQENYACTYYEAFSRYRARQLADFFRSAKSDPDVDALIKGIVER